MRTRCAERIDMGPENDARARMMALVNTALRTKYAEDEMVILRKYRAPTPRAVAAQLLLRDSRLR
jgi:hypothetical protein